MLEESDKVLAIEAVGVASNSLVLEAPEVVLGVRVGDLGSFESS